MLKRIDDIPCELLWSLYWGNGYDTFWIANIFGCTQGTILNRMRDYDIPRRLSYVLTDFIFNNKQKEIFEGCMFGDGHLRWQSNYCCFSNGDVHEDYLIWLQKQLGVEHISKIFWDAWGMLYVLRTRSIPSIQQDEYRRWYPNGEGTMSSPNHKIIPKDIELTPIKLLFWYIGDGHYLKGERAVLFTNSLVFENWDLLSKKIYKVLDVDNGITIHRQYKDDNGNQRYRLRLNKDGVKKLFSMVKDLNFDVPKCYWYKFGIQKSDYDKYDTVKEALDAYYG